MTIGKTRKRTGRTPSAILSCSQEDEFDNEVYLLVSKSFSRTASNNVTMKSFRHQKQWWMRFTFTQRNEEENVKNTNCFLINVTCTFLDT